jgi:Ca-activated chloride channel family protein
MMKRIGIGDRFPAIVLMTDGMSNAGSLQDLKNAIAETGLNRVPIMAITFGDASTKQLQEIADLTGGRVFDGTTDLISAFRKARGNN